VSVGGDGGVAAFSGEDAFAFVECGADGAAGEFVDIGEGAREIKFE
jgi:hypothetical protein